MLSDQTAPAALEGNTTPRLTLLLVAANFAAGALILFSALRDTAHWRDAFRPYEFIPAAFDLHTLIPSMFLHYDFKMFWGSVLFLLLFGSIVETEWGAVRFGAVYFAGAILGNLAHASIHAESTVPVLGAAGGVAALMGAVAVAFPSIEIPLVAFVTPARAYSIRDSTVPASYVLIAWFALQTAYFLYPPGRGQGVSAAANVVGFAVGALAAKIPRWPARPQRIKEDWE